MHSAAEAFNEVWCRRPELGVVGACGGVLERSKGTATGVRCPAWPCAPSQRPRHHAECPSHAQAWRTGDPSAVHDLLAPDCHTVNPVFGDKKASRQEWEETLRDVFKASGRGSGVGQGCLGRAYVGWRWCVLLKPTAARQTAARDRHSVLDWPGCRAAAVSLCRPLTPAPRHSPAPPRCCMQFWQVRSNTVDIAATPSSNKAFIWWHVQGVQKDTKQASAAPHCAVLRRAALRCAALAARHPRSGKAAQTRAPLAPRLGGPRLAAGSSWRHRTPHDVAVASPGPCKLSVPMQANDMFGLNLLVFDPKRDMCITGKGKLPDGHGIDRRLQAAGRPPCQAAAGAGAGQGHIPLPLPCPALVPGKRRATCNRQAAQCLRRPARGVPLW